MEERRHAMRTRSLLAGKILLNGGRSVIDCVVRNLSDVGACLQVASLVGIPLEFDLVVDQEKERRPCTAIWRAKNRIGIEFRRHEETAEPPEPDAMASVPEAETMSSPAAGTPLVRGELLSLRAALNEVGFGVVLLDREMRAQFINRAFRKMWRLPDSKADSKPAFVSLMYHGRDTRAYEIPESDLDAYVAERVALVRVGETTPMDIRLASGEVLRFQCTPLPDGGRMLSYTYVTDIVRYSDDLEVLRGALDNVGEGIILLDHNLTVQFMNRSARQMWKIPDTLADRKPTFMELLTTSRTTRVTGLSPKELERHITERIAAVRNGDPTPADVHLADGRSMRIQCAVLPNGGRMLTQSDVTDLVRDAAEMQHLATTDSMTDLYNRRHFLTLAEAEWQRFQRYQRPLSLLMFDIDHFKFINDRLGHDAGDRAIAHLAALAKIDKRPSDILARIGGDEFVMLLPETDIAQAGIVAERLREKVERSPFGENGVGMKITVSIGTADATLSMSGIAALIRAADEALYRAKLLGRNQVSFATPAPVLSQAIAAE